MGEIETIREMKSEVERLLEQAERAQQAASERVERLRIERTGLTLTLQRLESSNQSPPGNRTPDQPTVAPPPSALRPITQPIRAATPWPELSRTQAVQRALHEINRPTDRHEVQAVLKGHGRDDQLGAISATLSYLQEKGEAKLTNDGKWILIAVIALITAGVLAAAAEGGLPG